MSKPTYFGMDNYDYGSLDDLRTSVFPLNVSSNTYLSSYKGAYPSCANTQYYPSNIEIKTNASNFNKGLPSGKLSTYSKLMKSALTDNKGWKSVGTVVPENQSVNNGEISDTLDLQLKSIPGISPGIYQFRLVQYLDNDKVNIFALPIGENFLKNRLLFGPIKGLEYLGKLSVTTKSIFQF